MTQYAPTEIACSGCPDPRTARHVRFNPKGLGLCRDCRLDEAKVATARANKALMREAMNTFLADFTEPDPLGRPGLRRVNVAKLLKGR